MIRIKNEKDFWSGIMFGGVGLGFLIGAFNYDFGTLQRMGPGFFPVILGGFLALLGLGIGLAGLGRGQKETLEKFRFGPIGWVVGSVVLFGILLRPLGLLLSLVVLVVGSMLGSHEFRWRESAVVSAVMLAIVWGVFIRGLGLPLSLWPWFVNP